MNTFVWNRRLLYLLLFIKALFCLALIQYSNIQLNPDEAQYWTWSQDLDFGYYSKPPGIAWEIFLGCSLFGNTLLGVRIGAVVLGTLIPLALYRLALKAGIGEQASIWTAVIFALSPMGFLASFLATTDAGYIFFWILALCPVIKALRRNLRPKYLQVGLFIGLGALFKWNSYLLWLAIIVLIPRYKKLGAQGLLRGIAVSLIGLIPSLYWNWTHDFATFRHVSTSQTSGLSNGNPLEFIGAQFALLSPVFFLLLIASFYFLYRRRQHVSPPLSFCAFVTLIFLGVMTAISVFSKVQGNWAVFAYPTGIVFLAAYTYRFTNERLKWMWLGTISSMLLSVALLLFAKTIPYKLNPMRHHLGWDKLEDALNSIGYDTNAEFLFGNRYQTSSLLSFYSPEKKRSYFLPFTGARKNQFSYWPGLENEVGSDGVFVHISDRQGSLFDSKTLEEKLAPYFKTVRYLGEYPLFEQGGQTIKTAQIYRGFSYNGTRPDHDTTW